MPAPICSNIHRINEVTNNRQQLVVEGFSFYAVAEISTTNSFDHDAEEILRAKNIEVGSRDVMEILQISETTLKRWRRNGKLEFTYISINHVTYKLSKLYEAVNTGIVKCKGLGKIKALERILTYSKDVSQLRENND